MAQNAFQPNMVQSNAWQVLVAFLKRVLVRFRLMEPGITFKLHNSPGVSFRLKTPSLFKKMR